MRGRRAPSVVCELLVRESRASAGAHNGVFLEGENDAAALERAREMRPQEPSSPLGRRLLRVLTRSEIEAAELHKLHLEIAKLAACVLVGAIAIGGVARLLQARRR